MTIPNVQFKVATAVLVMENLDRPHFLVPPLFLGKPVVQELKTFDQTSWVDAITSWCPFWLHYRPGTQTCIYVLAQQPKSKKHLTNIKIIQFNIDGSNLQGKLKKVRDIRSSSYQG